MKRCCGLLRNVESARGEDLEPIRAQEREREIEREKGRFGWKEKTERQLEKEAFR